MRITEVKHSKTDLECGKCGEAIRASRNEKQPVTDKRTGKVKKKIVRVLGDPYRWIKFRFGGKRVRCMKPDCRFKNSDLTQNEKLSTLYSHQESAEAVFGSATEFEDLEPILDDLKTGIEEVIEMYEETIGNLEQAFQGGSPAIDEATEKRDELQNWCDNIENADLEEWDGKDGDEKNSSDETREEWLEAQRDKVQELIDGCPV